MGEIDMQLTLDAPDYSDFEYDPYTEPEWGEIEMNWYMLANEYIEIADTTTDYGVEGTGWGSVYIELQEDNIRHPFPQLPRHACPFRAGSSGCGACKGQGSAK